MFWFFNDRFYHPKEWNLRIFRSALFRFNRVLPDEFGYFTAEPEPDPAPVAEEVVENGVFFESDDTVAVVPGNFQKCRGLLWIQKRVDKLCLPTRAQLFSGVSPAFSNKIL